MSEQKHTPGPWFTSGQHGTIYIEARLRGSMLQEVAAVGPTETGELKDALLALLEQIRTHELQVGVPLSGGPLKQGCDMAIAAVNKSYGR